MDAIKVFGTAPTREQLAKRVGKRADELFAAVHVSSRGYGVRGMALRSAFDKTTVVGTDEKTKHPLHANVAQFTFYSFRRDGKITYNWGGCYTPEEMRLETADGELIPLPEALTRLHAPA